MHQRISFLIVDFLSIFRHADLLFGSSSSSIALILSISLWGFGLWAFIVNVMLFLRYMRREFPFFLGWWSYVFPTAA
ncbi:SLAC1 family transporter [Archaeoglobus sp.]